MGYPTYRNTPGGHEQKSMLIDKSTFPRVGIDPMNDVHLEEADLINSVLPAWMIEHISTLDMGTSQYIKSRM